ncbi:MAG: hypothetical protein D5S03_04360, partial [Desulfonatronospira sp. MSAO_Bac3]
QKSVKTKQCQLVTSKGCPVIFTCIRSGRSINARVYSPGDQENFRLELKLIAPDQDPGRPH